jgi:transporter family-2 protein
MTQALLILVAAVSGGGIAMQASMLGAIGAARSPAAGVWISVLATVIGLAALVAYRSATSSIGLPSPFDRPAVAIVVAVSAAVLLVFSARDLDPYFALTGLMPIPFIFGAGFLAPRLGVGLFISAVIAGQLTAAVLFDHIGAFGGNVIRVDFVRVAGIAALMVGVVLIRGLR